MTAYDAVKDQVIGNANASPIGNGTKGPEYPTQVVDRNVPHQDNVQAPSTIGGATNAAVSQTATHPVPDPVSAEPAQVNPPVSSHSIMNLINPVSTSPSPTPTSLPESASASVPTQTPASSVPSIQDISAATGIHAAAPHQKQNLKLSELVNSEPYVEATYSTSNNGSSHDELPHNNGVAKSASETEQDQAQVGGFSPPRIPESAFSPYAPTTVDHTLPDSPDEDYDNEDEPRVRTILAHRDDYIYRAPRTGRIARRQLVIPTIGRAYKHLKKKDGEPFWRRDIQYDFQNYLFGNKQKVFTNPFGDPQVPGVANDPKYTFAELYIRTIAESGKCSKILKERLLKDTEMGISVSKVCLLVNSGRMNTTINFVPEMRSTLRTYHSIPSLQADPIHGGSKQLQDTPRLKSILKSVCEGSEQFKILEDLRRHPKDSRPNTNVINVIFLLSNHTHGIKYYDHERSTENSFMDFFLNTEIHPQNRAQRFLWLMYTYLETHFSDAELAANPFGDGSSTIPEIRKVTKEEAQLIDIDTEFEKQYSEQMITLRQKYLLDEEHNSTPKRGNKAKKDKDDDELAQGQQEANDSSSADSTLDDSSIPHVTATPGAVTVTGWEFYDDKKRHRDDMDEIRKRAKRTVPFSASVSSPLAKSVVTATEDVTNEDVEMDDVNPLAPVVANDDLIDSSATEIAANNSKNATKDTSATVSGPAQHSESNSTPKVASESNSNHPKNNTESKSEVVGAAESKVHAGSKNSKGNSRSSGNSKSNANSSTSSNSGTNSSNSAHTTNAISASSHYGNNGSTSLFTAHGAHSFRMKQSDHNPEFPIENLQTALSKIKELTSSDSTTAPSNKTSMASHLNILNKSKPIIRQMRGNAKVSQADFTEKAEALKDWIFKYFEYKKSIGNGILGMELENIRYDLVNGIESFVYKQQGKSFHSLLQTKNPGEKLTEQSTISTSALSAGASSSSSASTGETEETEGFGFVPIYDFNNLNELNTFVRDLLKISNESLAKGEVDSLVKNPPRNGNYVRFDLERNNVSIDLEFD